MIITMYIGVYLYCMCIMYSIVQLMSSILHVHVYQYYMYMSMCSVYYTVLYNIHCVMNVLSIGMYMYNNNVTLLMHMYSTCTLYPVHFFCVFWLVACGYSRACSLPNNNRVTTVAVVYINYVTC